MKNRKLFYPVQRGVGNGVEGIIPLGNSLDGDELQPIMFHN